MKKLGLSVSELVSAIFNKYIKSEIITKAESTKRIGALSIRLGKIICKVKPSVVTLSLLFPVLSGIVCSGFVLHF